MFPVPRGDERHRAIGKRERFFRFVRDLHEDEGIGKSHDAEPDLPGGAVSLQLWGMLRRKARLDWWLKGKHADLDARNRLIADLVLDAKMPLAEIEELFTGHEYEHAPARLNGDERALIESLAGRSWSIAAWRPG